MKPQLVSPLLEAQCSEQHSARRCDQGGPPGWLPAQNGALSFSDAACREALPPPSLSLV